MWIYFLSIVLVICTFENVLAVLDIPSFIKVCKRNNPNLRKCVADNVEALKPRFKDGIPELFIPSLAPLKIPEATLNSGDSFTASFKDLELYNAHEFELKDFDIDLDKHHVNIDISFPKLRILSTYNIKGRILILNLDGKGPADGNYTDVKGLLSLKGTPFQKHKKEYIRWEKEKIDIKIGKINLYFDKIFGENEQLNEQTNRVINQNIDSIVEDFLPVVQQVVSDFIFGVVNRLFAKYSIDELFPRS